MLISPQIFSLADDYDIYKVLAIDFLLLLVTLVSLLDISFLQCNYMVSVFLKSE